MSNATLSLYEISNNYENIMAMLDQLQELSSNEVEQYENKELIAGLNEALEITEADFKEKSLAYCQVIRSEEASIDAIDSEIKRLQALKKSRESKVNHLKNNLSNAMVNFGKDKEDLGIFKLSFRSSESLVVDDEFVNELPEEYIRITIAPDKAGLKKALKEGKAFPGVSIVKNKSIQVK